MMCFMCCAGILRALHAVVWDGELQHARGGAAQHTQAARGAPLYPPLLRRERGALLYPPYRGEDVQEGAEGGRKEGREYQRESGRD